MTTFLIVLFFQLLLIKLVGLKEYKRILFFKNKRRDMTVFWWIYLSWGLGNLLYFLLKDY